MPDDKNKPSTDLVPVSAEPDPSNDKLIDDLQGEAQPKPKRCPHCGKDLPTE